MEGGVVEGKKDSWLREPGDPDWYMGVEGRDNGRGRMSLGVDRARWMCVGAGETGGSGGFESERGASWDDADDISFHVGDSAERVVVVVSSGLICNGGFSGAVTTSLRLLASSWASFSVALGFE